MRHDILSIVLLAILATTLINACLLLFMTDYAEKKSELQHIFLIMDSPGEGGATAPCLTFLEISRRADVTY